MLSRIFYSLLVKMNELTNGSCQSEKIRSLIRSLLGFELGNERADGTGFEAVGE